MNLSPLQKARYEYSPKLPGMLRGGIAEICVKEGNATESVADQDKIKALFPNTYGKAEVMVCMMPLRLQTRTTFYLDSRAAPTVS